ncbi:MAG: VWA domain-containing protein [Akkermansiaceae bacterium]|nr:VWA domain-containing protein [Akkermansiaceae bacterium]
MSFLNPLLLFAGLGLGLPILAHLLNRQKVKRTEWAAMQFLNRNVRVRSRQIRLRDLLLLCLRCLALLLLVLALARPASRDGAMSWIPGEPRAGVVIGLDASFSMAHGGEGATRFDRALDQVEVISGRIRPGDPVSVILLGGEDKVLIRNMAFDRERFRELVQKAQPVPAGLNLDRVPRRLRELVGDMEAPQKEVYFITDVQARDWRRSSARFQEALADLRGDAEAFMVPVPGVAANLAVTELDLVSGTLRKGTTARYQATVKNCGTDPVANVEVQCRVEGVQIDSKPIPVIAAGASETVSLFVPFHNAGPTRITAEITGDLLATDNVRRAVAVVRDRVSVLCVDGSDGDAGRLIVSALLARSDGAQDEDYLVRSVPWLSLPSQKLDEVDVIVLADVPEITPQQVGQLSRHVRQGNGLVWFAGQNVKAAVWNERTASGANPLLPAKLGPLVDTSTKLGAGRPLDPAMPDHSVCLPLRSLPEDLFSETRFLTRLDVEPTPSSFPILSLAGSGAPILLEHSLGRGHVFQFTTSADTDWNNMAQTPVFPMLMQQIVTYLAGREFEQPRVVGDSLSLSYVEQPDASDAVFDTPSGDTITVPVREHRNQFVAMLENAREAGFYVARVSVQAPGMPVAVNVDPGESDVVSLTASELNTNLEGIDITVAASDAELAAAIDTNRTGRSSWRQFMIAGLALLLIECFFADRLRSRKQKRGRQPDPVPETLTGAQDA